MDIQWIWISIGFGHGHSFSPMDFSMGGKDCLMDMDMDFILFNPIQTRPIAILKQDWLKVQWKKRCSIVSSMC